MRYLNAIRLTLSLFGSQWCYEFTNEDGTTRYDPPRHLWKTRIGLGTAWAVAKQIWL